MTNSLPNHKSSNQRPVYVRPLWWVGTIGVIITALGLGVASAYIDPKLIAGAVIGITLLLIIFKNPLAGMLFLIFFLPFERIGSIDVGGITIRISHVIAIITIAAWFIRGLTLGKFKFRPNPLFLPIVLFLIINILGLINAPNMQRAMFVLIFTVFTIGVSIAVPNILRHKWQIERALGVLLVGMVIVCLFGLYQFVGDLIGLPTSLTGLRPQYTKAILGFPRIQSTALEPLYFANYLLIPLSIAISMFLSKTSRWKQWWLIIAIGLGSLNLILTVSRGGYIALAGTAILLGLIYWKEIVQPRTLVPALIVIAIVGLGAMRFLNVGAQLENYKEHVANIFGGASYNERVETFDIALEIWNQHPWIGIGPGGFGPYAAYHPLVQPGEGFKIVNNEYIELLAETGILGLLAYCMILLGLFIRSVKALRIGTDTFLRAVLFGLLAALIGILVQYNTFSVLYIMHIWFTIGIIIAVQNLLLAPKDPAKHDAKNVIEYTHDVQ